MLQYHDYAVLVDAIVQFVGKGLLLFEGPEGGHSLQHFLELRIWIGACMCVREREGTIESENERRRGGRISRRRRRRRRKKRSINL